MKYGFVVAATHKIEMKKIKLYKELSQLDAHFSSSIGID